LDYQRRHQLDLERAEQDRDHIGADRQYEDQDRAKRRITAL
jgi:hypothetical protein